ncbi:hypothetical protein ElyMa_003195900 [Elysia marginata]|uniref:Uncharacterized protein n=1 Tax=Elysia marginata TaxID=1093978 RepID=A0AAV4IZA2_9GAST|nr:hypothetical protein ElyMa_003195900 [Elysia marginata]
MQRGHSRSRDKLKDGWFGYNNLSLHQNISNNARVSSKRFKVEQQDRTKCSRPTILHCPPEIAYGNQSDLQRNAARTLIPLTSSLIGQDYKPRDNILQDLGSHQPYNSPGIPPAPHNLPAIIPAPYNLPGIIPAPYNLPAIITAPHNLPGIIPAPHNLPGIKPAPHNLPAIIPAPHNLPGIIPAPHNLPEIIPAPHNLPAIIPAPHNLPGIILAPYNLPRKTKERYKYDTVHPTIQHKCSH